jgi:tetratricopeptide (TPR) repeat protein
VLALDPDNATAWARTCSAELYSDAQKDALEPCRRAVALNDTSNNYYNLGKAEEAGGEECDASDAYLKSSQKNSTGNGYVYMEGLGRAALRCGKDPYLALAGLRGALDLEAKDLEASDPKDDDDDTADERTDLATDRKYWAVLQIRLHDGKALAEACSAIDVKWKHCACGLNDKGEPECSGS